MTVSAQSSDFQPTASLDNLAARSELLRKLREFFHARGFIEVETPLVAGEVVPELHIEPMLVGDCPLFLPRASEPQIERKQEKGTVPLNKSRYLQSSPELHMKRLVAAGADAIYQVTRSFRAGERGRLHNPEFTIVEWYRAGDDMAAGMELLDELTQSLLGTPAAKRTSYAEAFQQHLGLCPHTATIEQLATAVRSPSPLWGGAMGGAEQPCNVTEASRDEMLNLLLATRVEPHLGRKRPEIVYHYPAAQASLAKTVASDHGYDVAERFELYYHGIELANGFHELTDAAEQRRRFEEVNAARITDGRPALPPPESLLAALEYGLPACTGCALGFDRLAMLAVGAASIDEVMAFPD